MTGTRTALGLHGAQLEMRKITPKTRQAMCESSDVASSQPQVASRPSAKRPKANRGATAIDHTVGVNIRALRLAAGYSLELLSEAIGVSWLQLRKYETAQNRVSAGRLFQIAVALDVPLDRLFYGAERDKYGRELIAPEASPL